MSEKITTRAVGSDNSLAGYPGYWAVSATAASGSYTFVAPPGMPLEEARAAAALMGASSNMLAALRATLQSIEDMVGCRNAYGFPLRDEEHPWSGVARDLDAAIALAEGSQS